MPPSTAAARYRARDGTEHDVIVLKSPAGRWRIVDASDTDVVHVETLTGHDDRLSQAEAVARDYAREMQAYHDGQRLEHPLPARRPDPPAEPACAA